MRPPIEDEIARGGAGESHSQNSIRLTPPTSGRICRRDKITPNTKSPFLVRSLLGMAAVWKLWKNPKTPLWEPTFAILTGEPNGKLRRFMSA